ncbi:MAG: DUF192 domain-containing protein [Patescibacteria group bacterium]|jgi:uncharacterized membrane protein (UPF0127 family)
MEYQEIKKRLIFLTISLVLILGLIWLTLSLLNRGKEIVKPEIITQALVGDKVISLELATTPEEHYLGLSNRSPICDHCGLLFLFTDLKERTFVMREMNFPLDIIFLLDGTIVNIYENLAPEGKNPLASYSSLGPVNQVLEVKAGLVQEFNLKSGSQLIFR